MLSTIPLHTCLGSEVSLLQYSQTKGSPSVLGWHRCPLPLARPWQVGHEYVFTYWVVISGSPLKSAEKIRVQGREPSYVLFLLLYYRLNDLPVLLPYHPLELVVEQQRVLLHAYGELYGLFLALQRARCLLAGLGVCEDLCVGHRLKVILRLLEVWVE